MLTHTDVTILSHHPTQRKAFPPADTPAYNAPNPLQAAQKAEGYVNVSASHPTKETESRTEAHSYHQHEGKDPQRWYKGTQDQHDQAQKRKPTPM